jgi:hypothetical protein
MTAPVGPAMTSWRGQMNRPGQSRAINSNDVCGWARYAPICQLHVSD